MCGILASLLTEGSISPARFLRSLRALSHRGPDGEGVWFSEDRKVGLGHRRLSIIGVNNGMQPIANEDSTIHVSVNGELYGFEAIRRDLQAKGHRFRTATDSEIVLHLYEDHATDCLGYLRGEFAFVLWDSRSRRLFAARDRFGVKPLVYTRTNNGIHFASEAKAIFAGGLFPAWDCESFFHASAMQYLLPDRTFFAGISQLPPGHFLLADASGVTISRYWDMDFPPDHGGHALPSDRESRRLIESCREHVVDAIEARLRSEVPVCCQLSGGLDSATVHCVASKLKQEPVDAFVIAFEAAGYDERSHAADVARHCGAHLHEVSVSQADLLDHLPAAVAASEGLAINGHLPAKFLLHDAIHGSGFKVTLTGEGADEVFGGYAHLRLDYGRASGQCGWARELKATDQTSLGMMWPFGDPLPLDGVRKRLGFVPAYLEAKATLGRRIRSLMHDDVLAGFRGRDAYGELIDSTAALEQLNGRHPVSQSTWLWSKTALAGYILKTLGDGTEMASAVEGRVPLLDHALFEFVRDVSLSLKFSLARDKPLLREVARPFISDSVYRRPKHPLDAPPLTLYASAAAQERLEEWLGDGSFLRQPFFCLSKCRKLLADLPHQEKSERQSWDPALMVVLSTLCMQHFLEEWSGCKA